MNFKRKALSTFVGLATLGLVACGGESGSQDSGADNSTSFTGLVVDGRVAGAKVWVDANNNYKIDDFEPYAFTDSDGYYSYNPLTNTNYCALPLISDEFQRYCLLYGSSFDTMIIRVKGGTDLSTGERLKGVMAMASTISSSSQISSTPLVLSPITTLLSTTTNTTQQANIRSALGVTSDSDFRIDFSTASDGQSKKFLANSVAVQTMMDILTNSADSGTNIATNQQNIVTSLAETVATQSLSPINLSSTNIQDIVKNVIKTDATKQSDLSTRLLNLNTEIQKIESAANIAAVNAQLKASEVVSQLIKKEHATVNPDTNVKKVLDSGIDSLSSNLTTRLNSSTVEFDIATITKQLVDAGTKATTTLNTTELDSEVSDAVTKSTLESITVDNIWAGHFLSLSGKEGTETGRVIAFFDGSATDSQGSASLCYAVNASNDKDDQASIVKGRWSKISKNTIQVSTDLGDFQIKAYKKAIITDDPDTTSVNEKNNYLGVGDGSVDSDTYGNFFFSSEAIDKDATWYSDFKQVAGGTESETWGLKKTVGTVPTTGDQCKTFDYGSFDNILLTNLGTLNPPK